MKRGELSGKLDAAVKALHARDLIGSELIFNEILNSNPKEPNALHFLGCICKERGDLQQAAELVESSIRADDTNFAPFLNLGKIRSLLGQHENALSAFKEALRRNQKSLETWLCLANELRLKHKAKDAVQCYKNVLALNPAHSESVLKVIALLTAEGKKQDVKNILVKAIESNPKDVNFRMNYGDILCELGKTALAIEQFKYAQSAYPDSPKINLRYTKALQSMGLLPRF